MLSAAPETHQAGEVPGSGTFHCRNCGSHLALDPLDRLPRCPRCRGAAFRRASIFEAVAEQPTTSEFGVVESESTPSWVADARGRLDEPGRYIAYLDDHLDTVRLEPGWSRIGRSCAADLRLDDPTVSRRHALIVWEDEQPLRVLDDRSLNGVYLNGVLVDWGKLADGDELLIGRYRLFLLEI